MNINKDKITRKIYSIGFSLKKHSPAILAVGGTVGVVAGTVMACKATSNLDSILEEHKKDVDRFDHAFEHPEELPDDVEYTEQMHMQDVTKAYLTSGLKIVKLYAPSVAVLTLSVGALLGSSYILNKRNIAIGAALTAETQMFKAYRDRVIKRFGEQIDYEIYNGYEPVLEQETVINEDGTEEVITKTKYKKSDILDSYSRCFDETNPYYVKSAEYNKNFLIQREADANNLCKIRSFLTLNDVYDMLGYERTKEGQLIGWVYDPENPNKIDFGLFDNRLHENMEFVNGYEPAIWLNFNVDGNLLNLLK